MNRLFLVRHGENKANLTKEFSHRLVDYPLTPKGRVQAEQTAVYLQNFPVTHVFTSPLIRARETAEVIAAAVNAPVSVLESFRELNVGALEQVPPSAEAWRQHDEIIWAWADGRAEVRFLGGENYRELVARVHDGYKTILDGRDGETLVLVAHGGSFALPLLQLVPNIDRELLHRAEHHNCAVSELEASSANGILTMTLVRWASAEHLSGEAAQFVPGTPLEGDL